MELKRIKKTIGLFFGIFLAINFNSFCFGQNKPYAASIFIDYSDENDLKKHSAITTNLSEVFYTQESPIIIFGSHLLINLVQETKFLKVKTQSSLKYFIEVKNALRDFDKNWIIIEFLDIYSKYLMIPRKHIEYVFNLDLSNLQNPLLTELKNRCEIGSVINSNGVLCKTILDIFRACGFELNKKFKYRFLSYSDLLKIKLKKEVPYDDFCLGVERTIANLFFVANDQNKWHLAFYGHGWTGYKNNGEESISGLQIEYFKSLFERVCRKKVEMVYLVSCYLGGPNRKKIEEIALNMFREGMCPCIIIKSPTDTSSYSYSPAEAFTEELLDQAKKKDLIVFEPKSSMTTFGLHKRCSVPNLFFRNKNIKESLFKIAVCFITSKGDDGLCLANWPLILDPSQKLEFVPVENEAYVYFVTKEKATNFNLQTNGQEIVFLDSAFVKNIKFTKKIPYLFSFPAESYVHIIEKIDASRFELDIKDFFRKIFINAGIQVACSKEFLIKELFLGKNKYLNIYVNQFYEENSKKNITDIIWRDVAKNKIYYNQYVYQEKDVKKGKKTEEWIENFSKELLSKDVAEYEKMVNETEKYVRNGFYNV